MIGRADIERSKSNVAMNAWLPQDSYPCDDEAFGYLKRDIVTSAVYPRLVEFLHFDIESTGQKSHCVNIRWDHCNALFSLKQSDSLVHTSSELVVRRLGKALEGIVHPSRRTRRPLTRYGTEAIPPTDDGFGSDPASLVSKSFSQSYESILPTSLAYIVPLTRGCSPWRPNAVMSTIEYGQHSVLQIFKSR
ncbi:hypothetical protein R3W88_034229 [Solanum pinnatisectum]|uniref:Uncharacterized protein n=1 Tax=Solanum pinnatisectum TaxID=50273 RepID=A0AAV9JZU1_9SOLN|nr:hypothetical protein R3W88_034229 [Solanum pinnatisectum]